MAASKMSVLDELYGTIFNYSVREEYTENVSSLNARDGMTLQEFSESDLAIDFDLDRSHMLDERKFYDGNHIFRLFSEFSDMSHQEVRELMISDIESSIDYYQDVCKVPLFMRNIDIDSWLNHMKTIGVRADEIAIFALAVCSQCHVVIYTHSKPWSTVNVSNYRHNISLYSHCSVHLLFMGNNLYGRLIHKPTVQFAEEMLTFPLSHPGTLQPPPRHAMPTPNLDLLSNLAESMVKLPESTTERDSSSGNIAVSTVNLQSPSTSMISVPATGNNTGTTSVSSGYNISGCNTDVINNLHQEPTSNDVSLQPLRANDQSSLGLDSEEVNVVNATRTVDTIDTAPQHSQTNEVPENLVTNNSDEPDISKTSHTTHTSVPDILNKDCIVKVRKLTKDDIAMHTMQLPTSMSEVELQSGVYFMRSQPAKKRHSIKPAQNTREIVYFKSSSESSTEDVSPKQPRKSSIRPGRGPSSSRLAVQKNKSIDPGVKPLSTVTSKNKGDTQGTDNSNEESSTSTPSPPTQSTSPTPVPANPTKVGDKNKKSTGKAVFETTTHGIKITKKSRSFKCKYCDKTAPSTKDLNKHYREKHVLPCCTKCRKKFSSAESLSRHSVMHRENKYPCHTCGKTFAFESKLDEHRITHRRHGNRRCNRGNCGKVFKCESDLDRHVLTHEVSPIKCDFCSYSNTDIRNVRQHMRKHDKIGWYICPYCNKRFTYHIQKSRHLAQKKCKHDKSDSPEY